MNSKVRIIGISDVSVGRGSPQVLALINSLIEHYGDAEGIIIEPDQQEIPPVSEVGSKVSVKRIYTQSHPHKSLAGRIEYIYQASKTVNRLRPDILVIFCTFSLPVLFKLSVRPALVIYYAYEMTFAYGSRDVDMNRLLNKSLVDLIIYPEENRAINDMKLCRHKDIPVAILFNCAENVKNESAIIPPEERNGRILYAGTLDQKRTFAGYYLRKKMKSMPLDLFGKVTGPDQRDLERKLRELQGTMGYFGYVEHALLKKLQKSYCYSITMWNPIDDQHLYAAPNKFFEAIADGIPPITAPHPQCTMLINRYKCGIVMDDWSFDSFYAAIEKGLEIYGTDLYNKMVENCCFAFTEELNWEKQFEKVRPYLKVVKQ